MLFYYKGNNSKMGANRPTLENANYETFAIRAFSLLSLDSN